MAKSRPLALPETPSPTSELLQEYNQLRERSGRTTNALASAAHDLKTPLADPERVHRTAAE